MNDFLKNLKKAVDTGETNKDIIDHHFQVLQGADMVDLLKANQNEEEKKYEQEVLGFLGNDTTSSVDSIRNGSIEASKLDEVAYIDEVANYSNDEKKQNRLEIIEQARLEGEIFENKRKKRELIEMNTAHIKLLEDEIEQHQMKILKNRELIEYLKVEMERE